MIQKLRNKQFSLWESQFACLQTFEIVRFSVFLNHWIFAKNLILINRAHKKTNLYLSGRYVAIQLKIILRFVGFNNYYYATKFTIFRNRLLLVFRYCQVGGRPSSTVIRMHEWPQKISNKAPHKFYLYAYFISGDGK